MTQYAAIIYSRDVDWTLPEYAEETARVRRVRRGRRRRHPRRRRALPDLDRHHRAGRGQGRRRRHHRRALRRDQGGPHRLLPARVRRPRRGGRASPRPSRAPGTAPSRCAPSSSSRCERRRLGGGSARPRGRRTAPWPSSSGSRAATSSPPSPAGPATSRSPRTPCRTPAVRALQTWPRDGIPDNPAPGCAPRPGGRGRPDPPGGRPAGPRRPSRMARSPTSCRPRRTPSRGRRATTCSGWCSPAATPASRPETRVALALRTLCGLATAGGRPGPAGVRGDHGQAPHPGPAEDPAGRHPLPGAVGADLPERWDTVLATTYLLFNEGYAATAGPERPARRSSTRRCGSPGCCTACARRARRHRPAGADPAAGLAPRRPHRRRRRRRAAGRPGPHAVGPRRHRRGRAARRRGAAALARPPRPLRRAGRDRRLPRPRADVGGDRLGRDRVLVRRAAPRGRHAGGAAQPGRGGRRARRPGGRARPRRRDRRPARLPALARHPGRAAAPARTGPARPRPPTTGPAACRSTPCSATCSTADRRLTR